jgi:hypothetical protein
MTLVSDACHYHDEGKNKAHDVHADVSPGTCQRLIIGRIQYI